MPLSDAGIYKPRPRLVGGQQGGGGGKLGGKRDLDEARPVLAWAWPETMLYQHFSAREDADTAMLTFLPGRGNLCDIVRGKEGGGVQR